MSQRCLDCHRSPRYGTLISSWLFFAGILLASLGPSGSVLAGPNSGDMKALIEAAEPAFRAWIASVPDERLPSFGFETRPQAREARLLSPIRQLFPARDASSLQRGALEGPITKGPAKWVFPVAVADRIVCLVVVRDEPGQKPVATEFGKTYAANRLNAAYRLLGWSLDEGDKEARLISFFNPVYELLLARVSGLDWTWVNLSGTTVPDAAALTDEDIDRILSSLSDIPSDPQSLPTNR